MPAKRSPRGSRPENQAKVAQARKLAERGLTLKAIAANVALSESTLRRHGIKPRPKQRAAAAEPALKPAAAPSGGRSEQSERHTQVTVGDFAVDLDRTANGWRCAARAPETSDADAFEQATRQALIGGAIARAINQRVVKPEHVDVLAAHMVDALDGPDGSGCDATADGAHPVAFSMAAIWALNQLAADLERQWAAIGDSAQPLVPADDLLDVSFAQRDPLRDNSAHTYADTCVERAMRSTASGPYILVEHFPIEILPCEVLAAASGDAEDAFALNSPVYIAERLGVGSVVGGDLGFLLDAYEAHAAAGTGVCVSGPVVVSAAHRMGADTQQFRSWARKHLSPDENTHGPVGAAVQRNAVCGVLDTAVYGSHGEGSDTDLAVAAAVTIAETMPDLFEAAGSEFYAYGLEQPEEILAPFAAHPDVAAQIQAGIDACDTESEEHLKSVEGLITSMSASRGQSDTQDGAAAGDAATPNNARDADTHVR